MDGDPLGSSSTASPSHGVSGVPSPQFAILNYLFPGFSIFSSAAKAYFETDINAFLPLLLAVLGGVVLWTQARESLWGLVDDYLMSSVSIRTDDEVYNMVMLWLSKQGFARRSRHFVANTDLSSRHRHLYRFADSNDSDDDAPDSDDDDGADAKGAAAASRKKALHYTPAFGSHLFWYKGHPLFFERHKNHDQLGLQTASEREELALWCFGRSPRIFKELLVEARQLHVRKDERKTLIYRGNLNETYWQRCMSRLNRPFSTVILDEAVKKELLDDAADYLDPAMRRWYANRGIPYRRGYLLHGPLGTGKSSLSLALAGYFLMKIYIVSLSSTTATEENITTLFHELPTRCIVLLEDIGSAGLTHTRDDASVPRATSGPSAEPGPSPPTSTAAKGPGARQTPTEAPAAGGPLALGLAQHPRRRRLAGGPHPHHDDQPRREARQGPHPPGPRRHDCALWPGRCADDGGHLPRHLRSVRQRDGSEPRWKALGQGSRRRRELARRQRRRRGARGHPPARRGAGETLRRQDTRGRVQPC